MHRSPWPSSPGCSAKAAAWRSSGTSGTSPTRWSRELTRISKWDTHQPYPVGRDFGRVVDASGRFEPVVRTRFPFTQALDRTAFVEQVATRSYVAVLPEDGRRALLEEVAEFAATLEEPILLPYIADTFCTRTLPADHTA